MNRNQWFTRVFVVLLIGRSWASADQGEGWLQAPPGNVPLLELQEGSSFKSSKKSATVASRNAVSTNSVMSTNAAVSTVPLAPEIRDLANALGNDPLAMFNWVRNHVDYKHYRGEKKGSLTTLVELSGNDCDQSLLLRDLLTAAGIPTRLNYGWNWIPYQSSTGEDIRHWLGLPQAAHDNDHADRMLLDRGTQASEALKYSTGIQLRRTWVEATIQGQTVEMDPSFKKYEQITGVDLAAASGYVQLTALNQLSQPIGGIPTGIVADGNNSLANANEAALGVYLKDRSAALVQAFKQAGNAGKTPLEVTGGWRLQEWTAASLGETFPLGSYSLETQWDNALSPDMQATIRIRVGTDPSAGQFSLERTMTMSALAGKRLTLEYATSGSTTKAQLWLDDTLWGEEPAFVSGATVNLEIQMSHPTGLIFIHFSAS